MIDIQQLFLQKYLNKLVNCYCADCVGLDTDIPRAPKLIYLDDHCSDACMCADCVFFPLISEKWSNKQAQNYKREELLKRSPQYRFYTWQEENIYGREFYISSIDDDLLQMAGLPTEVDSIIYFEELKTRRLTCMCLNCIAEFMLSHRYGISNKVSYYMLKVSKYSWEYNLREYILKKSEYDESEILNADEYNLPDINKINGLLHNRIEKYILRNKAKYFYCHYNRICCNKLQIFYDCEEFIPFDDNYSEEKIYDCTVYRNNDFNGCLPNKKIKKRCDKYIYDTTDYDYDIFKKDIPDEIYNSYDLIKKYAATANIMDTEQSNIKI
jgi:hypothetical protein